MPAQWYNHVEAKAILDNLKPNDLDIIQIDGKFEWILDEEVGSLEGQLDKVHYRLTDQQVGYTLDSVSDDPDKEEHWLSVYEAQPTLNDVLIQKFGDPNWLRGYGIDSARRVWKRDPSIIKRAKRFQLKQRKQAERKGMK